MTKKESSKFNNSNIFEGMTSISALIKGFENGITDRHIEKILFDESKIKSKSRELSFLKAKSYQHNFEIEITQPENIDLLTVGNTHGGIIALCGDRNIPKLSSETVNTNGVYFILEGVEDPYNFGYSIRSLYAAGIDGIIVGERNWMGAAGIVARSSAGTSELMNMFISDPLDAISVFKSLGFTVVSAGIRDSVSLFDTSLSKPLLVILGGEKRGISRSVLDASDKIVRIDYGNSFGGSLSTSAASAVFAFEILRYNRQL